MFLEKNTEILNAELWIISEVLDTVMQKISAINNILITIFSNSQKALIAI